jgi:hypothetical protein
MNATDRNRKLKRERTRNIVRNDDDERSTHGYTVRIRGLFVPGERVSKHFSDSRHGSPGRALREAINWRNDILRDFDREVPE